jgi:transcriptional regulator with XRE-family HTH domain
MTPPALAQPPTPAAALRPGPEIIRQRLGTALRAVRVERGILLGDAATELGVAASTLSRIETGKSPTRTSYLSLLLNLYQVTDPDLRRELADLAREGQRDSWWEHAADLLPPGVGRYVGLEHAASHVRVLATQLIPALLQEPGYTAAAIRVARSDLGTAQTRALAALTSRRQELLHCDGFMLHAIIDETALLRAPANTRVLASQLSHLTTLLASPNITLQVLRLTTPWPVVSSPFTLLTFPESGDPEIACTVSHGGQYHLTRHDNHIQALSDTFAKLSRVALRADASTRLICNLARHPSL